MKPLLLRDRDHVWALRPEKLAALIESLREGDDVSLPVSEPSGRVRMETVAGGRVAVIPIHGVIEQRAGWGVDTSADSLQAAVRQARADSAVRTIVLDVDSPGGSVFGLEEAAREIFQARQEKRVVAVSNSEAASAAYYLASQAGELVVTPGGMVGSIGTVALHVDASQFYESRGIAVTVITAGKYKWESHPFKPLDEEPRAQIQETVDAYYGQFVRAVARGRATAPADVRSGFGEGRMVLAEKAVEMKMADRVATLSETLSRVSSRFGGGTRMQRVKMRKRCVEIKNG